MVPNRPVLSSLSALLLPLGLFSAHGHAAGSYQRTYASARVDATWRLGGHTQAAGTPPRARQALPLASDQLSVVAGQGARELVIMDAAVTDKATFYRGLRPGVDIVEIDSTKPGLEQLKQALASYHGLTALHIVSHAEDGVLLLGNSRADAQALQQEMEVFSALQDALVEGADLLLYGCDTAKGENGEALLDVIRGQTHLDVAASSNKTGNAEKGGDWDLEIQRGSIETELAFSEKALKDFSAVLATTFTLSDNSVFTYREGGGAVGGNVTGNCPSNAPTPYFYHSVDSTDYIGCGFMHNNGYGGTTVGLVNYFQPNYAPAFLKMDGNLMVAQSTVSGTNHIEIRRRTGSFQLANVVADEFAGTSVFNNVRVTGYPAGGGAPITSTAITSDNSAPSTFSFTSAGALVNFAGVNLTKFRLTFINQAGSSVDYMRLSSFATEPADTTGPTISSISNQNLDTGSTSSAIPFTIGDNFTPVASISVTRASSNATAVPLANVVLGGSGASRTVTITGASVGTSTITIAATDRAGNFTTRTFTVFVTDPNAVPVNSVVPNVSGTATVGNALSSTSGAWTDADGDTLTYTYQWYRADDASGTNAVAIGSATSSSYTLTTSDAHKYLRAVVTANDGMGGSAMAASAYTAVLNSAPTNTVAPNANGTATVGNALSATNGTWTDADGDSRTYSYQWYRADDNGGTGMGAIGGANGSSYTLTTLDAHKYIRVAVTANDGYGGIQSAVSPFRAMLNSDPTNTVVPTVSGTAAVGNALSTTNGTWTDADGDSRTYSYHWYRADDGSGASAVAIGGATASSYTLTASDARKYLRVTVTANDGHGGTQTAGSTYTAVMNRAPTNITLGNAVIHQSGGVNAVVGTLGSVDPDGDTSFTYSLQSGIGGDHNASFNISGSSLRANDAAAMAPGLYNVRVQTDDGAGGNFSKAFTLTVADDVAPTVTGVTSTTPNGTYKAGDAISIQVSFGENVTVTGTPTLALNSGGMATSAGGSTTSTLTFIYTVLAGENSADLDYASANALQLNGGTLRDGAGVNAALTLPVAGAPGSLAANKAIVIDGIAPTVSSIALVGTPGPTATSLQYLVTFSEPVNNVSPDDFALTGTASGTVASVSAASGSTVTVTVSGISGAGSLRLDVKAGTNIVDGAGNPLPAYTGGADHVLEAIPGMPTGVTATATAGQAEVTFTAPASDGGRAITRYTATSAPDGVTGFCDVPSGAPAGTVCAIPVTGLTNGTSYTFKVKATNTHGEGAESTDSNAVVPRLLQIVSADGGVPGMTGVATATLSGGGANCTLQAGGGFGAAAQIPTGLQAPHGQFSFTAQHCSGTVTITLAYPQPLPQNVRFRKFDGTGWFDPRDVATSLGLALSGDYQTVTYSIADNGLGDTNELAGTIADPLLPVVPLAAPEAPVPVPTLGSWALALLSALLAVFGRRRRAA